MKNSLKAWIYHISISFGTLTLNVAVGVYLQVFGLIKANRLDATCMKLNNYKVCEFSLYQAWSENYVQCRPESYDQSLTCQQYLSQVQFIDWCLGVLVMKKEWGHSDWTIKIFIVSYETVVLCQSETDTWKFGFMKPVDKGQITTVKDLKSWCFKR